MKTASITVELIDKGGSDLSVVNAARVSFHKESEWDNQDLEVIGTVDSLYDGGQYDLKDPGFVGQLGEKDQKLLNYLATHNHWSPFAHTWLSFRCKAPIFLARQLVKHQVGGSWNEVSRRYVDDEPEFWFPSVIRQRPNGSIKQGSGKEHKGSPIWMSGMKLHSEYSLELYNDMIKDGVAPEQARVVLPQNTMTEWVWSGSIMFFARVFKLRADGHAQQEAQDFANLLNKKIPTDFFHSWAALTN